MKVSRLLLSGIFAGVCMAAPSYAKVVYDDDMVSYIYRNARSRNAMFIRKLQENGQSLEVADKDGNTAVCRAIIDRDKATYEFLKAMGAEASPPCAKKLLAKNPEGFPNFNMETYGPWAAAAGLGAVLAFKDDGKSAPIEPEPDPDPEPDPEPDPWEEAPPLPETYFETDEYRAGNFLEMINASKAYARVYKEVNGTLTPKSDMRRVTVGIVDTGIAKTNTEFTGKNITGYNFDYGPCRRSGQPNCWYYNPTVQTLTLTDGTGAQTTFIVAITPAEYAAWVSNYDTNYVWNASDIAPNEKVTGHYHGTLMAGIIAANRDENGMHGVAFQNADLVMARVDLAPNFNPLTVQGFTPMVEYLINTTHAQVINFSLAPDASPTLNASFLDGLDWNAPGTDPSIINMLNPSLNAFKLASANNTIMVFAAGNEGYQNSQFWAGIPLIEQFKTFVAPNPDDPDDPANTDPLGPDRWSLENLFIVVAALDELGTSLASYSNHCGAAQNYCLSAPGTGIISTIPPIPNADPELPPYEYSSGQGTSQATAVVTGSVAFLLGEYPWLSPQEIVNLLFTTADKMGACDGSDPLCSDIEFGQGRVNLGNAVAPAGPLSLAAGTSINEASVPLGGAMVSVPGIFQGAFAANNLPAVTAFDSYNRPYDVPLSFLMRPTSSDYYAFKNDVFAFSKRKPVRRVKSGENLTFGFSGSNMKISEGGIGFMDVAYEKDNRSARFYYAESTGYNGIDNYFDKGMFNPFLSMNQAYGMENAHTFNGGKLGFKTHFTTGENGLYDGSRDHRDYEFENRSYAFDNEISYNVTDTFKITAMGGVLYENEAMLGMNGTGAFRFADSSTNYAGMGFSWNAFENFTLSGMYYSGWTRSQGMASNLMQISDLRADTFAFDGRYLMNKGRDIVGFQISSPLRINKGSVAFDVAVGRDKYSDEVYRQQFISGMKPDAREYKFSLYHMKEVDENLNFKSEFDVRLNPGHRKDAETDYRALFGLNWDW